MEFLNCYIEPIALQETIIEEGIEYTVKTNDDGDQMWYWKDQLHRKLGPAVIYPNGSKYWFWHGKQHRVDGPATILSNGDQYWWYQDQAVRVKSQPEFEQWLKLKIFL